MEQVQVIILECGTKAKEVNPLGKEPRVKEFRSDSRFFFKREAREFKEASERWQAAENERKTFEIEPQICKCALEYGKCPTPTHCFWEPSTIHNATIIGTNLIRIE